MPALRGGAHAISRAGNSDPATSHANSFDGVPSADIGAVDHRGRTSDVKNQNKFNYLATFLDKISEIVANPHVANRCRHWRNALHQHSDAMPAICRMDERYRPAWWLTPARGRLGLLAMEGPVPIR